MPLGSVLLLMGQTYRLPSPSSSQSPAPPPSPAPADGYLPRFSSRPLDAMQLLRPGKKMALQLYPAYGNEQSVTISGRVVEAERISRAGAGDSWLTNLRRNLKLLSAEGKEDALVDVCFNGEKVTVKANDDGMFTATLKLSKPVTPGYQFAQVSLSAFEMGKYSARPALGLVSIQATHDTSFGIITDIDDTIQKSDVTSKLKAIQTLLFRNATTQQVIPGTPELYQALDRSSDGRIDGDVTYISGSPIQINGRIEDFLDQHHFPAGAFELKKMGFDKSEGESSPFEVYNYKLERIRRQFETYPDKKFYLFGDSGQKDPEVYTEIAKEYPGRVLGIYINNVTGDHQTDSRYQAAGIKLTATAADAARDLFAQGVLTAQDVATVQQAIVAQTPH